MILEFKCKSGGLYQLWFDETLVTSGNRQKVEDCYFAARSLLELAGVQHTWIYMGKKKGHEYQGSDV